MTENRVVDLPYAHTKIEFLPEFRREALEDLARQITVDEELAGRMRTTPVSELEKLGVRIHLSGKVSDEDLLSGLGQGGPEVSAAFPVAVVVVAIIVTQVPHD
jgi:hypothetical protein